MSARAFRVALLAALVAACSGAAPSGPTPAPALLPLAELRYRVMDAGGRILFCDPDFYPVARADEAALARARIADIQKDAETYAAITKRIGSDTLAIYRDWKALNALALTPLARSGTSPQSWSFSYRSSGSVPNRTGAPPRESGTQVDGTVDAYGKVDVTRRVEAGPLNCPICLARGTRIATPAGEVAVEALRVGDVVWTQDASGARVAAALVAVGRTPVPDTHRVVRLALGDGRVVHVSPGHPTADGRSAGALHAGDVLDGARVVSTARVPYAGGHTFDILPAGATGAYWANGILLASTLR